MSGEKTHSPGSGLAPALDSKAGGMSGFRHFVVLWFLFFAICFGLGYPILKRYDPRTAGGLSDTPKYYAIVTGADTSSFKEMFRCRVLVPYVARPFYWFAQRYLPSWNPGFFGLLMASALFCATTACLISQIGTLLLKDRSVGLLGAALYLLSFNIPNQQLSGLIDAGEACFMTALVLTLLSRRWYLLPIWGVLGALAKETFVPFSFVFALTWWLIEARRKKTGAAEAKWIVLMAILGLATVSAVHSMITGQMKWPWSIAGQASAGVNFFKALWDTFTERSLWYVFGWLIPLGIWRLKYFPRPWLAASIATCALAILLGAYSNAGGTIGRSTFDIVGPLLSLSVALLIAGKSDSLVLANPERLEN